jgi:hypothetical protein
MKKVSSKELFAELDILNKDGLKYIGVQYIKSGNPEDVENHLNFIKSLKVDPVYEFEICNSFSKTDEFMRDVCIVIRFPVYVNIYRYDDVVKIRSDLKGISMKNCVVKLC